MGLSISNWIFASEWEVLVLCFLLGFGGTVLGFYLNAKKQKDTFEILRAIEIGATFCAVLFIETQAFGTWFSNGEAASLIGWLIFNFMAFIACLFALPAAILTPKGKGVIVKAAGLIWVVAVSGIAIYFSHWALFSDSISLPSPRELFFRPTPVVYPSSSTGNFNANFLQSETSSSPEGENIGSSFATGTVVLSAGNSVSVGGLGFDTISISKNEIVVMVTEPSSGKGEEMSLGVGQSTVLFGHTLMLLSIKQISYSNAQGKPMTANQAMLSF